MRREKTTTRVSSKRLEEDEVTVDFFFFFPHHLGAPRSQLIDFSEPSISICASRLFCLQVAEVPDLPRISLPSSTLPLPTFDFTSPLPPLSTASSKVAPVTPAKDTLANKVRLNVDS